MRKSDILVAVMIVQLLGCASRSEVKVGDGKVEEALRVPSGATTENVQQAIRKGKLTLSDLYPLAVEQTERLAIKEQGLRAAEAQRDVALGAWLPKLSVQNSQYFYVPHQDRAGQRAESAQNSMINRALGTPVPLIGSSGTSLPPAFRPGTKLVLNVPIFTGLNEYAGLKGADAYIAQARFLLRHEAGRLYLDLSQNYFTILQLEQGIETADQVRRLTLDTLTEMNRRVALGRNRRGDLLNTSAQLARLEADIQNQRTQLAQARDILATITGLDADVKLEEEDLLGPPEYDLAQAIRKADSRGDVQAAEMAVKVAKANLIAAWGGHLPTVALTGYYMPPAWNQGAPKEIIGQFSVTLPLFSGGQVVAQVKQAEAQKSQAEMQMTLTRKQAVEEIRRAYQAYRDSAESVQAYEKAMNAAEINYQVQVRDSTNRLNTVLDVLTALTNFQNAKNDYVRARLTRKLNRLWLGVATGEIPVPGKTDAELKTEEKK